MIFSVVFAVDDKEKRIVESVGAPGLDILDEIREKYPQYNDLSAENVVVDTSCPINGYKVVVNITEKEARLTNRFGGQTQINVLVPEFGLSKFLNFVDVSVYSDVIIKPSLTFCGQIFVSAKYGKTLTGVNFSNRIDRNKCFSEWVSDGCPSEWQPNL